MQISFLVIVVLIIANPFLRRSNTRSIIQNTQVKGRITSVYGGYSKTDNYVGIDSSFEIRTTFATRQLLSTGDSLFKEKGDSFYTVKKQLTGKIIKFYVWGN